MYSWQRGRRVVKALPWNLNNRAFGLLLTFALLAAAPAQADDNRKVVIGADPWCPFICPDNKQHQGLMVDVAREALAATGYDLEYRNINWARAKKMTRSGALDGLVGTANLGPEKSPYDFPETALGVAETCFYRKAENDWTYSSPASLNDQFMGWINDYGFDPSSGLNEWIERHRGTSRVLIVSGTSTHPRLFKLLLGNRISTFAEDRYVTSYKLKDLGLLGKIEVAGCTTPKEKVYVAFSQKTGRGKALAKALDEGVRILRENGRLKKILAYYGLTPETWMSE